MSVMCSRWLQGQPSPGEAAVNEAGLVLNLLQAVADDLDQVAEAGDGEVGQHAALEHGPDSFHRIEVGGVGRELEHVQPRLGAGEGAQLRAQMHVEVVPDQDDDSAGQLAVRGDQQVPVLTPGERLGLALAAPVQVQPVYQPAAVAGAVAGQPGHRDVPGAAAADADDRGDPAPPPGPGPRRPQRLAGLVFEDDPAAATRSRMRASVHRWSWYPAASGPASSTASSAASWASSSRHRVAWPLDATPATPPASQAARHRRTDRSLTRSSAAITATGTRCSNLSTASSRTCSRRLRPSAVNPPPCPYRIHPAYRQGYHLSLRRTSLIKDLYHCRKPGT